MSAIEEAKNWLKKQGFPLEMLVAAAFRKQHFDVFQSIYYLDPQEHQDRELDLLVSDPDHVGVVRIEMTIECKSSQKPWVILAGQGMITQNRLFLYAVMRENTRHYFAEAIFGDLIAGADGKTTLSGFERYHWLRKDCTIGYGLRQTFSGNDPAYTALMSATKAAHHFTLNRSEAPGDPVHALCFPVVVIDAPLLVCELGTDGEVALSEVEQGEVQFPVHLPNRNLACVRVVTLKGLDRFVSEARKEIDLLREDFASEEDRHLGEQLTSEPKQIAELRSLRLLNRRIPNT